MTQNPAIQDPAAKTLSRRLWHEPPPNPQQKGLATLHGTMGDTEHTQIHVLNQALKQAIVKELQGSATTV